MLPEASSVSNAITGNPSITFTLATGNALRVYNGDKYRLRDATPIELHDGEDRSGIDINIPTNGLHSLHGYVVTKPDGHRIKRGEIRLLDPDDKTTLRETLIQSDGSFTFNYIVTGSYLLQVEASAEGQNGKAGARYEPVLAPLLVERDIPDLSYSLTSPKN